MTLPLRLPAGRLGLSVDHAVVPPRASHGGFRPDIEGLRGVAVLLVVLFHVHLPGVAGGFIGVDVFFVLSGFLITGLLVREATRTGRINFVQFCARRTRRLLPAAVLVLAATIVVGSVVFSPLEQRTFAKSAIATSAYLSNVQFMRQAADYFGADAAADPFLHTWSLAVEEQFYLVWPLLVALGLSGRRPRVRLVTLVAGVCAASFAACVWLTMDHKPWAFFGSPLRAWEFGLGGLAMLTPISGLAARPAWSRALGWTGLALILGSGLLVTGERFFPGPLALLAATGTVAVLLAGGATPDTGVARPLGTAPLQHLGRLSYSWYLWHWPVLVMASVVVPDLPLAGRLLAAGCALGLAAATFALVENPVRFHATLVPRPRLSLGLAGGLSAAGLALAFGAREYAARTNAAPRFQAIVEAKDDAAKLYRDHCLTGFDSKRLRQCIYGDSLSPTVVVLFGDSHAAHWFPAIEHTARARGWRLVTMLKAGCPTADVPVYSPTVGRDVDQCAGWRAEALRRILALRARAVVLSNSQGYVIRPGREDGYSRVTSRQWQDGSRSTFSLLDSAGVRVIALRDAPRPEWDVPICLSRAEQRKREGTECSTSHSVAADSRVFDSERRAAEGLQRVSLVDLTDLLCGPETCEAVRDGMIVYRDNSHLTATYVQSLAPRIAARLAPLVPPTSDD